ncbi:MAG: hypothetical protein KDD22_04430 [Bdellovibrionales bacterium]|nr:hypothetical protein [Bdellovibrionales bacterium]
MKNEFFKRVVCGAILMSCTVACAKGSSNPGANPQQSNSKATQVEPVTLESRYGNGNYETATYSFRYLTRDDLQPVRNNWELLFEGRSDFKDYFTVNMVVDDNSFIYDLGEKSCADISSSNPKDRKDRPMAWLAYSDADPSELEPVSKVEVKVGHCYLTYNNDEDGRVIALFHVKDHVQSKSVTIDEIEVLNDLRAR